jgi:hypothetical protein
MNQQIKPEDLQSNEALGAREPTREALIQELFEARAAIAAYQGILAEIRAICARAEARS